MISQRAILGLGTALAAVGLWWLLPGSKVRRRTLGGVLAILGLACFGSQTPAVGDWITKGVFHAVAGATIVAAVATISFRSPVYCAIWFSMTLTGVAGLFLLNGAEFLAVATLVVYAGAILVTFLFVLMLSQPEGHTSYDRRSWEAMLSALTGAVLVGVLTTIIGAAITQAESGDVGRALVRQSPEGGLKPTLQDPNHLPEGEPAGRYSVAQLGAQLFTRYLVAVEAAGALLFAALVGAAVIVTQGRAAMKRSRAPGTPGLEGDTAHAS